MRRARAPAALAVLAALGAAAWSLRLPDPRPLRRSWPRSTAYIELRREQAAAAGRPFVLRWRPVPYARVSEHLKRAVVTAEDDGFWRHKGIDWEALRSAWERDLAERKLAYGGSTITQQLARNLYLSPSRDPLRKLREALIARRLERTLGKRRILELYLNVAEWGPGVFGCEAAALEHFAKPCADLSPEEAVALAVVLPNPRRWSASRRGPYVERNSRRIIRRLEAAGLWGAALQSGSTSAMLSTGSADSDQGRNPATEE